MGDRPPASTAGHAELPIPAPTSRPRPTGRSGSWVDSGHQASARRGIQLDIRPHAASDSQPRSAIGRPHRPPDMPSCRSQHLPLGLGRRAGPAAGLPADPKPGKVVVICILTELITARTCSCTVETGACERWYSADLRFSTLAPRCPNHAARMLAWAWDRFSTAAKPRRRGAQVLLHGRDGRMRAVV